MWARGFKRAMARSDGKPVATMDCRTGLASEGRSVEQKPWASGAGTGRGRWRAGWAWVGGPWARRNRSSSHLPLEIGRKELPRHVNFPALNLPPVWSTLRLLAQWQPTLRPACRPCGMALNISGLNLAWHWQFACGHVHFMSHYGTMFSWFVLLWLPAFVSV